VLLAHSLLIAGDVEQARDVTRQVAAAADATADTELRLLADTCAILDDGATGRGTVADLAALHARAQRLGNVHVALLELDVGPPESVRSSARRMRWPTKSARPSVGTRASSAPEQPPPSPSAPSSPPGSPRSRPRS